MAMFSEDLFSVFEEESDSKAAASKKRTRDKNEGGSIKLKRPKSDCADSSKSTITTPSGADSQEDLAAQNEPVLLDEPVVQDEQAVQEDMEEADEKEEQ